MHSSLIGQSKAVKNLQKQIRKVATGCEDVVIIGERGTGRSVVARSIHDATVQGDEKRPLVIIKPYALNEHELHTVLFGYAEGTPGPRHTYRKNLVSVSNGGTILIEELEAASFRNQLKILTFLNHVRESRSHDEDTSTQVRIIVTIKDVPVRLAARNEMLTELAHRLSDFQVISVPALRARKEDIPYLVQQFVSEACQKIGITEPIIDIHAIGILVNQPWKGNIRELKAVIERSVLFSTDGMFTLPAEMTDEKSKATRLLETVLTGEGQEINGSLDTIECSLIRSVLRRFNYDYSKAAVFLGMNERTLAQRVHQLGLARSNL